MNKILFIDSTHPVLKQRLETNGFVCDYFGDINYCQVSEIIWNYIGVIIRSQIQLDKEILSNATNLRFIGRVGSGLESIDTEFAKIKNIECINSPEGSRDAVGEQAIGMILSLLNYVCKSNIEIKNGKWLREENRGTEIKGKTIGIIGYGNTGSAFARKLSGFETNVISYDKYKTNYSDGFTKVVNLDDIFNISDIVSLHVPLTSETRYMADDNFFNNFHNNIFLINTSRGSVVKISSLIKAISENKVLGAALDVIEYEETSFDKMNLINMPDDFFKLLNLPNVLITPHTAGWTHESKIKLAEVLAGKIIEYSRKKGIIPI